MANKSTRKISSDLFQTVAQNSHIDKVYFAANGHHYFNCFDVKEKDKDGKPIIVQYARTRQIVSPSLTGKPQEVIEVGIKDILDDTTIVETLTREQILGTTPEPAASSLLS